MSRFVQTPTAVKLYLIAILVCQSFSPALEMAWANRTCVAIASANQLCGRCEQSSRDADESGASCQCCCKQNRQELTCCSTKDGKSKVTAVTLDRKPFSSDDVSGFKQRVQPVAVGVDPCNCVSTPSIPTAMQVTEPLQPKRLFDHAKVFMDSNDGTHPFRSSCSQVDPDNEPFTFSFQTQFSVWRL